jgi:hypothetical protein
VAESSSLWAAVVIARTGTRMRGGGVFGTCSVLRNGKKKNEALMVCTNKRVKIIFGTWTPSGLASHVLFPWTEQYNNCGTGNTCVPLSGRNGTLQ